MNDEANKLQVIVIGCEGSDVAAKICEALEAHSVNVVGSGYSIPKDEFNIRAYDLKIISDDCVQNANPSYRDLEKKRRRRVNKIKIRN